MGISLSKLSIQIHMGKFPWVTCLNRSGKEEVIRNRHGLCKQIKSHLVPPTRHCKQIFMIFYLRRNKDEEWKKSSHKLHFQKIPSSLNSSIQKNSCIFYYFSLNGTLWQIFDFFISLLWWLTNASCDWLEEKERGKMTKKT